MRKTKKQIENEQLLDKYLNKLMEQTELKKVKPKNPFWGIFDKK